MLSGVLIIIILLIIIVKVILVILITLLNRDCIIGQSNWLSSIIIVNIKQRQGAKVNYQDRKSENIRTYFVLLLHCVISSRLYQVHF